eukprot:scaffold6712_cov142-Cylindrotheca_fusiformis.AAC.2
MSFPHHSNHDRLVDPEKAIIVCTALLFKKEETRGKLDQNDKNFWGLRPLTPARALPFEPARPPKQRWGQACRPPFSAGASPHTPFSQERKYPDFVQKRCDFGLATTLLQKREIVRKLQLHGVCFQKNRGGAIPINQEKFNKKLALLRIISEHTIGMLKDDTASDVDNAARAPYEEGDALRKMRNITTSIASIIAAT